MEHENRKLIRLVDVETQEALWLWYPCIRAGKITIAEGDPGAGKAMRFPCSAAAVPSGALLPLQAAPSLPPRLLSCRAPAMGLGHYPTEAGTGESPSLPYPPY